MQNKGVLPTANDGHAGCFQFRVATGPPVYRKSPTVTVNFCTVHNSGTSLLTFL